ncbi:MAG: site-specific integrase, partial [Armatimonadia bacterium]
RSLDRPTVQAYVEYMLHERGLRATSANQALAAIKKMVTEAMNANLIAHAIAAPILVLPGAPVSGARAGNWLSRAQAQDLLLKPDISTPMGKRDQAALALLIGAALRRSEVCGLQIEQLEQRRGRWVISNMLRKGGRLQTLPIPSWTYDSVARWMEAAGLTSGPLIRGFAPDGVSLQPGALTAKQLYMIVRRYGAETGSKLAPHDLRRTAADLMWESEASMREIQTALGHKSVTTTEIYMQPITDMKAPACDRVKFEV